MPETLEAHLGPSMLARIDEWRRLRGDCPTRADAIRRLIEFALQEHHRLYPADHQLEG